MTFVPSCVTLDIGRGPLGRGGWIRLHTVNRDTQVHNSSKPGPGPSDSRPSLLLTGRLPVPQ